MADGKVIIDTELNTKDAEKQSKKLGNSLSNGISKGAKVARTGLMAVGAVAVATGGALVKMAKSTADTGDHIDKMSQKLGISAEAYQKWDYVAKISGTSIDSLKMGFKTLTNTIDKANKGDKEAATQFNKLGVSMDDLKNKSKEDIFKDTVKGLQNVKNQTERSAMANKLFGRSGMEMGALLNSSNGSIDELMKTAEDYGMVMSDKAVKASAEFKDSLTTMQMTATGLKNRMMGEFLPSMTQVTDGLALVFKGDTNEGIEKINEGITNFVGKMSEIMPKVLEIGGNIIMTLATALLQNLPQLLTTGTEIALELLQGIINAIPTIITGLLGAIPTILNTLMAQLPTILNSLVQGLSSIVQGLVNALPTILTTLVTALMNAIKNIYNILPQIIKIGIDLVLGLAQGILEALPLLIEMLPQVIESMMNYFVEALPMIINGIVQLITMIVEALPTIITTLLNALPRIISMVITALIQAVPTLIQGVIQLVLMLVQNLPKIILALIKALPKAIVMVVQALIKNLPTLIKGLITLVIEIVKNLPKIIMGLIKAIPTILVEIVKALITNIPILFKGILNMIVSLVKKLPSLLSKLWEWIKGIPKKVWGFIKGIASFGADLVKGLWEGIKNLGSWIWDKIKGFCSGIVKSIKKFFGIKSPSKLMKDQVGKFIAQGIWVGFDENNPMKQINDAVANGVQALDTNIKMQSVINYDKMVDAFANSGLVVEFNNREVGRMVREFA